MKEKASILNMHMKYAKLETDGVSLILPGTTMCALSECRMASFSMLISEPTGYD